MTHFRYTLGLFFSLFCLVAHAQTVDVLDKSIERLQAKEGLQVGFRMTLEDVTTDCKYYAEGRRFYYDSEEVKAWYDGTDLWVYVKQSGEVNLSTPHKEDLMEINPLLNLEGVRKHAFSLTKRKEGKNTRVTAVPRTKGKNRYDGSLARLEALIAPDGRPISLRLEEKGLMEPVLIEVTRFEEGQFKELKDRSFFRYTPEKIKGATLIDLR
ncbi:LolA-like putative outer membrane lipoprotein chaperone [uncultured Porphyromonas sp.]|uniref:LolA-like putative outer membrane lipoprotein chaperone n=1 Tax=uncultured Porphyromonas sp. TaxID=159274 RepID=UPI0025935C85|nr:LolA-like putative outer membrane lipoprotein chaperone [uncultured Porphyromonas sp.]